MATRSCVYKDCGYFYSIIGRTPKGPWTIFSFPKQPDRARIWLENAQVHPKIPKSQLFICSKHFDTKFISSNKNRTMLVGEAIPFPYINKNNPDPNEEYSAAQENISIKLSDDELDELLQEAVKNSENKINIESPPAKRSKESPNAPHAAIEPPSAEIGSGADCDPEICSPADCDPDHIETIDTSEVSVFHFKGQEYVQMSMEFYMLEKRKMAELVKKYQRTLRNIKDQVNKCMKG